MNRLRLLSIAATFALTASAASLLIGQTPPRASVWLPSTEASSHALPLPEDRGAALLEQDMKRLNTTASLLMIVAHPDDEDGSLLTYLSRGLGVRCTLFTLTRGEGGQNVMSADTYDALGLIRTNELLKADEYYGAKQLWGTEADFGFSKTQEEAFSKWGHERVLYDAVLAVRREKPQIIVSTFVGGVTDGHGQHQVSGEIAQEVFKAAADPKVFPDQLKPVSEGGLGLTVWQPSAVYSMVPFAPITGKGMFDYATGKWAPAKFKNYVTGQWSTTAPSADVIIPVGTLDPTLGRSYSQIARQGWGMQKSQNGGGNPTLSGPGNTRYHLWAVATASKAPAGENGDDSLFKNAKVNVNTSISGMAALAGKTPPDWLTQALSKIDSQLHAIESRCPCKAGVEVAHALVPVYRETITLRGKVAKSELSKDSKANLLFALDQKTNQFQSVLADLLGLDMIPFRTRDTGAEMRGFRGNSADETLPSVAPGEKFFVRIHTSQAFPKETQLDHVWLESNGTPWPNEMTAGQFTPHAPEANPVFTVTVPENAKPTAPYFTRPTIEQPFYDVSNPQLRDRSFAPWPLAAWVQYSFDGVPIRIGKVVQTLHRVTGPGGIYDPLVVTPRIGVSVSPEAQILPLDGSALPVRVTVHAQQSAEGTITLKMPEGWSAEPASSSFKLSAAGDTQPALFKVKPSGAEAGAYSIQAIVTSDGKKYESGWHSVGYGGLRPYNQYLRAELKTRKVDVRIAPGLRIGYVMGPGDLVPDAIEAMGGHVEMLSDKDLKSADLSGFNAIVIGIRAYSVRPALWSEQSRLNDYVINGGTVIVQYQSATFPAPLKLSMGDRTPERVVDETDPVKILAPQNALLNSPNEITSADFDGWVEERGHSFLDSWDKGYTALTETADPGQDPQDGGWIVAHPGKGTYIYVAYALYRQLPELVPGSYRILANLLSAGEK
ncbi:MAG: PIG-L family deacetylase [Acidobacteriota bacterium]|nr:PIG-L family deacetylase [Acidobacteriota bacterium]